MIKWMEYHNLKKLTSNMEKFHSFNMHKNVVEAWRLRTRKNIKVRRIMIYLK
jgi:hypothetical protein